MKLLLAVVTGLALQACDITTSDRSLQWVSPAEAEALTIPKGFSLGKTKSMVYVDPRNSKDFAAGHIPGAVLVPFSELREGAVGLLNGYDVLVVYDTDYDGVISKSMSKRLIEYGEWEVYTMTGGLKAWEKTGLGVDYGLPEVVASDGMDDNATEAIPKPSYRRSKKK